MCRLSVYSIDILSAGLKQIFVQRAQFDFYATAPEYALRRDMFRATADSLGINIAALIHDLGGMDAAW